VHRKALFICILAALALIAGVAALGGENAPVQSALAQGNAKYKLRLAGLDREAPAADPQSEFQQSTQRWGQAGPRNYNIVIRRTVALLTEVHFTTVTNGNVSAHRAECYQEKKRTPCEQLPPIPSPVPIPGADAKDWTVEGLFALIGQAAQLGPILLPGAQTSVTYNQRFGFPATVSVGLPLASLFALLAPGDGTGTPGLPPGAGDLLPGLLGALPAGGQQQLNVGAIWEVAAFIPR
jgi:hypothetical protein